MAQVVLHPSIASSENRAKDALPTPEDSFLQMIEYDAASLQLTVTMKTGAQYQYFSVYPAIVEDLKKAPSKGKFYAQYIRGKMQSSRIIDKSIGRPAKKKT